MSREGLVALPVFEKVEHGLKAGLGNTLFIVPRIVT